MKLQKISACFALAFGLAAAPQARADNWGCEVLLCLSNPAGPMAVAQCVPPITRLYRAIFKWRPDPFPSCTMSNGSDSASGGNYAFVAPPSFYDACPSGTSQVGFGGLAAVGRLLTPAEQAAQPRWNPQPLVITSSTVGSVAEYQESGDSGSYGWVRFTKVCGGNFLGQVTQSTGTSWDDYSSVTVNVYDRVVLIDPAVDSFNINVMLNNSLFRNIRPFSPSTMRNL